MNSSAAIAKVMAVVKGAALAFVIAGVVRFVFGGYSGEDGSFMLLAVMFLGPAALALPTLGAGFYLVWNLIKSKIAEAFGAALAIAAGFAVPQLLLNYGTSIHPVESYSEIPKNSVLIFGNGVGCYGSSACGSELITAGYTVGSVEDLFGKVIIPVPGMPVYLTRFKGDAGCKVEQGFAVPSQCEDRKEVALGNDFIFISVTLDPATDGETFTAVQNGKELARAKRDLLRTKTWSPFYFIGDIDKVVGVQNRQTFIRKFTHIDVGD